MLVAEMQSLHKLLSTLLQVRLTAARRGWGGVTGMGWGDRA
jgi:hypothetical protein